MNSFVFYSVGHSERAMLYHDLEDGIYSVGPYFFAKVTTFSCQKSAYQVLR